MFKRIITSLAILAFTAPTVNAMWPFECPFTETPEWGEMTSPDAWDRLWSEYSEDELIEIPKYNIGQLAIPLKQLVEKREYGDMNAIKLITAKLYYSTRFMGRYNLNSLENTGDHEGMDLKQPLGTPIRAVMSGKIVWAKSEKGGLGNNILIRHGGGFHTVYGHMERMDVERLDTVEAGQVIGTVGMTGNTMGPHLHLELRFRGEPVNPMDYISTPCN